MKGDHQETYLESEGTEMLGVHAGNEIHAQINSRQ